MRDSVLEAVVLDGALGPATDSMKDMYHRERPEKSPSNVSYIVTIQPS